MRYTIYNHVSGLTLYCVWRVCLCFSPTRVAAGTKRYTVEKTNWINDLWLDKHSANPKAPKRRRWWRRYIVNAHTHTHTHTSTKPSIPIWERIVHCVRASKREYLQRRCYDIMYKYMYVTYIYIWSYATAAHREINDKKRFTPNWHG